MAFKVKYTEQASEDITGIIEYISYELCSPKAAEKIYKGVSDKIGLLRDNPYLFPLYHDEKLSAEGYRFAVVGNYLIFYVIDNSNSAVTIVRILYGRRNIPAIIEPER